MIKFYIYYLYYKKQTINSKIVNKFTIIHPTFTMDSLFFNLYCGSLLLINNKTIGIIGIKYLPWKP